MAHSTDKYADIMLDRISQCISEETKNLPALSGAKVSSVNSDGTINVYFPPDDNKIFTNISNQTPFNLQEGDSVELLLKDGSYNNCWIVAKHQDTFNGSFDLAEDMSNFATKEDLQNMQAALLTETDPIFASSPAHSITQQDITRWNNAVVVTPTSTTPKMDSATGAVGSENAYARGDHVHPTDTTRAPLASPALTGVPTAPTADVGTNTTQIATTAFVKTALDNKSAPVTSVNNKTGAVVLTASDVGAVTSSRTINGYPLSSNITLSATDVEALPNTTVIPSKTSQLTNDSGFITSASLPEEVFVVTYNGTTGDKTFAEIRTAYSANKVVILNYNGSTYVLEYCIASYCVFAKAGTAGEGTAEQGFIAYVICTSGDEWSRSTLTITSKTYVDNLVNSLGTLLNFKGTKATVAELPSSGNNAGDVWIVTEDSAEYVWNGTSWEQFGPTIDLSGYLQIEDLANSTGISTTTAMTQSAVTSALDTKSNVSTTVTNVGYNTTNKAITKTINGNTSNVVTVSTIKSDLNLTKSDVGLSNVENKNSATIRSELTSTNVTDALGYTPPEYGTLYTFTGGTNSFTATPLEGEAQTVTITPSIANNITGSGTQNYLTKFDGTNTITNGPAIGNDTTSFLRNDGSWAVPNYPVTSVNNKTGTVNLTYSDVNALPSTAFNDAALTGIPTAPTAPVGTDTTQIATTAFVQAAMQAAENVVPASETPLMDSVSGAVGTSIKYAREDHSHPIDTTRAPIVSPNFTGAPTAPTPIFGDDSTNLATTEFVQDAVGAITVPVTSVNNKTGDVVLDYSDVGALPDTTVIPAASSTTPAMNGTAAVGTESSWARGDHVHPTDTSRAAATHVHGNITSAGDITTTATIASGDRLVINDESASKVTNSSITFGTGTTTYLRNDGQWGTPANTTTGTTYAAASVPNNTTFGTQGSIYNVYNATKHSTVTVTLSVAGWNSSTKVQSVTASGVTTSNLVLVSPAPASTSVYSAAGVYCSAQGSNSLTFTCSSIPTAAITVNVVIMS